MNAYSLDLRKKIVEAKERGMPTVEVAKTFGVGVSTVKRYAATARDDCPSADTLHVARGSTGCLLRGAPLLARDDVGGIPLRPVVLGGGLLVVVMLVGCLAQPVSQSRNVHG